MLQARYFLCVIRIRFHQRVEVARVRGGGGGGEAEAPAEEVEDTNAARADRWRGVLTTALEQMAFLFEFTGSGQSAVKKFGVNMWENIRLSKAAALAAASGGKVGGGGGRGRGGKGGRGRGRGRFAKRAEDEEAAAEPVEEDSDVVKEASTTTTAAAAAAAAEVMEEDSDIVKEVTTAAAAAMEESGDDVPWWRVSDFKVSVHLRPTIHSSAEFRRGAKKAGGFVQRTDKGAERWLKNVVFAGVWNWALQAIGNTQSSRKYMAAVRKVSNLRPHLSPHP